MKKLIVLVFASILSSNTYSLDFGTSALAYSLAQTIYAGALTVAASESGTKSTSKREKNAIAQRIQKEAQDYFQTGIPSIYLENKIQMAKGPDQTLSVAESVDLLINATNIILAE